jgi:predicted hydrolase (HD superfamily)
VYLTKVGIFHEDDYGKLQEELELHVLHVLTFIWLKKINNDVCTSVGIFCFFEEERIAW